MASLFSIFGASRVLMPTCFSFTVDKPAEVNFTTVRETLVKIVPLCLDSDPSLIPLSCKTPDEGNRAALLTSDSARVDSESDQDRDPDDFSFWSERQAKRICAAIKQIFDVEYAPEVVVADANLTTLANRILVSKEILSTGI
jgi:phosphatidylethanolamine N-methyltransferase